MAAIAAAYKGHSVTLFERTDKLGGQWNLAAVPLGKSEFASLISWQEQELKRLGVPLHLNKELSVEELMQQQPDVVLVATGSKPLIPPISGIKQSQADGFVVTAHDVLAGKEKATGKIAVIGGGLVGAETAEWLAVSGCDVTLIELQPEIVKDGVGNPKALLIQNLKKHSVTVLTNTKVLALEDSALVLEQDEIQKRYTGFDKIILAVGVQTERTFMQQLQEYTGEYQCIGDAKCVKNGYYNIQEGFEAGLAI